MKQTQQRVERLLQKIRIYTSQGAKCYDESIVDPLVIYYVTQRQENAVHTAAQQPYAALAFDGKIEFEEYVEFPTSSNAVQEYLPLLPLRNSLGMPQAEIQENVNEITDWQPVMQMQAENEVQTVPVCEQDELGQFFLDQYAKSESAGRRDVSYLGRALRINTELAEDVFEEFVNIELDE